MNAAHRSLFSILDISYVLLPKSFGSGFFLSYAHTVPTRSMTTNTIAPNTDITFFKVERGE